MPKKPEQAKQAEVQQTDFRCTSGRPQEASEALPYKSFFKFSKDREKPCGLPLVIRNGALICGHCDSP